MSVARPHQSEFDPQFERLHRKLGYHLRRPVPRRPGVDRILMASSTFDRLCGGTAAAQLVKEHLAKQGLIRATGTGIDRRFAMKRVIAGKRVPVMNLSADLME